MLIERIPDQRFASAIGRARAQLAPLVRHRLRSVRFVCGVDPAFIGLHATATAPDGRSYRDTAHCCYPHHVAHRPAPERVPTIVLPQPVAPYVIVHELGHALDWLIGRGHTAAPVTDYARTNRSEAFAEAFTAWHYWYGDQDAAAADGATLALFRELEASCA